MHIAINSGACLWRREPMSIPFLRIWRRDLGRGGGLSAARCRVLRIRLRRRPVWLTRRARCWMGLFAELCTDGSPRTRPVSISMSKSKLNLLRCLRDGNILRPDAWLARCAAEMAWHISAHCHFKHAHRAALHLYSTFRCLLDPKTPTELDFCVYTRYNHHNCTISTPTRTRAHTHILHRFIMTPGETTIDSMHTLFLCILTFGLRLSFGWERMG
jgi:hypothetical protein